MVNAEKDTTYNGWKNYETWNVALWIGNDEGLYHMARECSDYAAFAKMMDDFGGEGCTHEPMRRAVPATPDGVAWNDSGLDTAALDSMITEL